MTLQDILPLLSERVPVRVDGPGVRLFQFFKAPAVSTEKAVEMMNLTKRQIEVTMFAAGVEKLEGLKAGRLTEKQ